ncbi:unnamed protein product [Heligmosomoides polygyrus]|uniref:Glyco_transf_7N domain-containing protein n=1 Tax=Heligmosomoides polygyrus TaxID=6339 RepID=A0A183GNR3_HELPZ|nr:unnamed protein product [Heligmosomoides polygyrus]
MARQRRALRTTDVFHVVIVMTAILVLIVVAHYIFFSETNTLFTLSDDDLDLPAKRRSPIRRSLNISIVVVVNDESNLEEYKFALDTVRCYALMHNYTLLIVSGHQYHRCRQRDTMFRRHCVVAEILRTTDWVLFIDADIGIVNPTR